MTELATGSLKVTSSDDIVAETRFGDVPIKCVKTESCTLFSLERHHGSGINPPHNINHHANIESLKEAGVDKILSICSVGAIPHDFPPGSIAVSYTHLTLPTTPYV